MIKCIFLTNGFGRFNVMNHGIAVHCYEFPRQLQNPENFNLYGKGHTPFNDPCICLQIYKFVFNVI